MKLEIAARWIPEEQNKSNRRPQSRSPRPRRKAIINDKTWSRNRSKVFLTHIGMFICRLYTQPLSALTTPYLYQKRRSSKWLVNEETGQQFSSVLASRAKGVDYKQSGDGSQLPPETRKHESNTLFTRTLSPSPFSRFQAIISMIPSR